MQETHDDNGLVPAKELLNEARKEDIQGRRRDPADVKRHFFNPAMRLAAEESVAVDQVLACIAAASKVKPRICRLGKGEGQTQQEADQQNDPKYASMTDVRLHQFHILIYGMSLPNGSIETSKTQGRLQAA